MKSAKLNTADYFFGLLSGLSSDTKLKLINMLSKSLKRDPKGSDVSLQDLFGSFKSKHTAEQIISDIRNSRNFSRKMESL